MISFDSSSYPSGQFKVVDSTLTKFMIPVKEDSLRRHLDA